ncbi:MAG: serine/threonine protein phosphatase [Bacteroidetes bacterium HGW-Bacteroidetes-17]|jgi:serine/threonine protein phosphatase 1|nr:MAG: serine/threonine protein phosphatase [Bacteroidetes bacterium HGW-Bacteroidetes-17]
MLKQWVIPDIHGCVQSLKQLIEVQIQPQKQDELYFLGDYIDRGPDSKGVIDYLMSLKNNGYKASYLKGNHEKYFLRALDHEPTRKQLIKFGRKNRFKKEWFDHGGDQFMQSFMESDMNKIPLLYSDWIKNLKNYILLEKHLLVHAGLNFKIENPLEDTYDMLWTRDFEIDPLKIDNRLIIHGHVPVHIDIIHQCIHNDDSLSINLDNGVYLKNKEGFGSLTAYELNSKRLIIQDNLDK